MTSSGRSGQTLIFTSDRNPSAIPDSASMKSNDGRFRHNHSTLMARAMIWKEKSAADHSVTGIIVKGSKAAAAHTPGMRACGRMRRTKTKTRSAVKARRMALITAIGRNVIGW